MVPVAALQVAVTVPVSGAVLSVTTALAPPAMAPRAPVQLLAPCVQFSVPATQVVEQLAALWLTTPLVQVRVTEPVELAVESVSVVEAPWLIMPCDTEQGAVATVQFAVLAAHCALQLVDDRPNDPLVQVAVAEPLPAGDRPAVASVITEFAPSNTLPTAAEQLFAPTVQLSVVAAQVFAPEQVGPDWASAPSLQVTVTFPVAGAVLSVIEVEAPCASTAGVAVQALPAPLSQFWAVAAH